jgi:ABC-type amino acid transport substrate-binding protein
LELIPIPVPWASLLDMPRQGRADFIVSSITRLESRERDFQIAFSEPYYCTTHALIYRTGTEERPVPDMIAGKIVGVQEKTTNARVAEELLKVNKFQLLTFSNTETLIEALLQSKVDYGVSDIPFAMSARLGSRLDGRDRLGFKEFNKSDFPPTLPEDEQVENYAIALRAGEDALLKAINGVIAAAKTDGSLARLLAEAVQEFADAHKTKVDASAPYAPGDHPWECAR